MKFRLNYLPNIHRVEIELTVDCNLLCKFCDRRCSQAPSSEYMPLEQIYYFVEESLRLNHRWESIGILGGEPTLHPNLIEVISTLNEYKKEYPDCNLFLVTNSYGNRVKESINRIRGMIKIEERPKNKSPHWFNNVDLAPVDYRDEFGSCKNTNICGLGFSARGYFPCGPAAAIARVLDMDIGIKSLNDVNQNALIKILKDVCKYCGHSLAIPVKENSSISPFWKEAYEKYHKRILDRKMKKRE